MCNVCIDVQVDSPLVETFSVSGQYCGQAVQREWDRLATAKGVDGRAYVFRKRKEVRCKAVQRFDKTQHSFTPQQYFLAYVLIILTS